MAAKISQYSRLSDCAYVDRHLIVFSGQAESGKSCLCLDTVTYGLLQKDPIWKKVIILSPTGRLQDTWNGFSDVYTDPEAYSNIIKQVLDYQEANIQDSHKVLIIMDDIMGSISKEESAKLRNLIIKLATAGRHYKICLWLLTQSLKNPLIANVDVRNNLRTLVSTVVTSTSKDELIKLVGSKDAVEHAFRERYRFIVYDNCADSIRADSRISYVRIDPNRTPRLTLKYY